MTSTDTVWLQTSTNGTISAHQCASFDCRIRRRFDCFDVTFRLPTKPALYKRKSTLACIAAPLKHSSTIASHARPPGWYLGHILFRDFVGGSRSKEAHMILSTIVTVAFRPRLFGSASAQIYNYWWNYPDEPQLHRHAVATVWSAAFNDFHSHLTDDSCKAH